MTILEELDQVLAARKNANPADKPSYVADLYTKGTNKILEKVGEEATEVIIAAKELEQGDPAERDRQRLELAKEVADLWFHSMVLLQQMDMSSTDVLEVLAGRFGVGGLEEKAARGD